MKKEEKDVFAIIHDTANEIMDEVIAPICGVPGINANMYVSKIADYDNGNQENRRKILDGIVKKYVVPANGLEAIQEYPLGLIALYILDVAGRKDW